MKARPKPKPWVTNALTGKTVSPDVDWLINRLAELNPLEDHPGDYNAHVIDRHAHVVDSHAHQVHGQWLSWRHRGDNTAIRIRGTQRPRAERVPVTVSTEKELKRLRTAAQGPSDKRWITAWLGVSSPTHGLIFRPLVPPVIRREYNCEGKLVNFERADLAINHRRISVPGHGAIIPTRAVALPLIEAALRKHEAIPVSDRKKREGDALADDVARAVARAYRKLTGKRGLYRDGVRGLNKGGLLKLASDIEARFGCIGLLSGYRLERFS